jgi:hypothetical protein
VVAHGAGAGRRAVLLARDCIDGANLNADQDQLELIAKNRRGSSYLSDPPSSFFTSAALLPTLSMTSSNSAGETLSFLVHALTCRLLCTLIFDRSGAVGLVSLVMNTSA